MKIDVTRLKELIKARDAADSECDAASEKLRKLQQASIDARNAVHNEQHELWLLIDDRERESYEK
jgi:hypothetical protein